MYPTVSPASTSRSPITRVFHVITGCSPCRTSLNPSPSIGKQYPYNAIPARTIDLLRANLKELGVDQVDLAYTHSIGHTVYDFDQLVGDKGPMASLERAKKDELTRFIGITGHNRPEKFARVLGRRNIDAMMNAVNIVDRHTYSFETLVWPTARKQNIGLVAMKVFGGGIRTC